MKRLALLVLLVLSLAVAACSSGSSESASEGGGASTVGETAVGGAEPAGKEPSRMAATKDSTGWSAVSVIGPRIVRTASLRLSIAHGRFDEAVQSAGSIATSDGGFVASSSESRNGKGHGTSGTLVLRVRSDRCDDAMTRLSDLGRVTGREESGQDVSAEFVDLQARRRHLEAVEAQLLKLLEQADSVPAALAVQSKLDDVQLALEETRGQLRYLDDQTSFATITLSLVERAPLGSGGDGGGVLDAWADGAHAFGRVTAATFVFMATIAPVLILLGAVAFAGRYAVRRRAAAAHGAK